MGLFGGNGLSIARSVMPAPPSPRLPASPGASFFQYHRCRHRHHHRHRRHHRHHHASNRAGIAKGILFSVQDRIERLLGNASAGGAGAGFVAAAVTYPLDLVRTRVAGHVRASGEARSASQVTIALVREQGVLGLYGGAIPTFVGALFFEGARFGIYRWLMDK